ncbi:integral membrane protein PTH11 [Apiospora marii]|uniref:integral membrane protein PTH11 n=1 Tax=Apiospora marii TaxID=335849 RepID=UPI00312E4334
MTVRDNTSMAADPIAPEGLGRSLMVVTIVMTVLASAAVAGRLYVRSIYNALAVDDWMMLAGWILNLGHNASVIVLATYGMGAHDYELTAGMGQKISLWTIIWQFIYVLDGALIKSSIIVTMLRLANRKEYKIILWTLFGLTWATWQISWPVAIFQCKPVSAAWTGIGDCKSGQKVILQVSYFVSAVNIFTDLATALTPILLLRHLQMPDKVKYLTMAILSLGVFASVATTIRISYTWAYTAKSEQIYTIGKIVLLTVLECDLGLIAGSLPMLRRLFPSLNPSQAKSSNNVGSAIPGRSNDVTLVTIGGGRRNKGYKLENSQHSTHPSAGNHRFRDHKVAEDDVGKDNTTENNSVDNDDHESTRRMIHVTREIEQSSITGSPNGLERTEHSDHSQIDYPNGRFQHAAGASRGNPNAF